MELMSPFAKSGVSASTVTPAGTSVRLIQSTVRATKASAIDG